MLGNVIGLTKTSIQFMLNKRKAQGLSITTIILVVLGLLILAAIAIVVGSRWSAFNAGVDTAVGTDMAATR
jgi:hypothetical protein